MRWVLVETFALPPMVPVVPVVSVVPLVVSAVPITVPTVPCNAAMQITYECTNFNALDYEE